MSRRPQIEGIIKSFAIKPDPPKRNLATEGNISIDPNIHIRKNQPQIPEILRSSTLKINNQGLFTEENIELTGNLYINTATLFLDNIKQKIGILTTEPTETLDVSGNLIIRGNIGVEDIISDSLDISDLSPSSVVITDANSKLVSGIVNLESQVENALPIANGGTNSGTGFIGNMLIVSKNGAVVEGTSTLNPKFNSMNLSELNASHGVTTDSGKNLSSLMYASTTVPFTLVKRDVSGNIIANNLAGALMIEALDGVSPSPDGATLTSSSLFFQSADTTNVGMVNNTTQSFAGNKTFTGSIMGNNLLNTNTNDITVGALLGISSATGATLTGQQFQLNTANSVGSGVMTNTAQTIGGNKTFLGLLLGSNLDGTNTGNLTIGTVIPTSSATGATLTGQQLRFNSADASGAGIVTTAAQTFAGAKTFTGTIAASNYAGTNTGDITLGSLLSTSSAEGATLTGLQLQLNSADASGSGVVTDTTQSFAGNKTLTGTISGSNLTGTNTGSVTLGTLLPTSSATGATVTNQQLQINSADASGAGVMTNTTQSIGGNKSFTDVISASNLSGTNTGNVTIGSLLSTSSANGVTLTGQQLRFNTADASGVGLVNSIAQTISGDKTFDNNVSVGGFVFALNIDPSGGTLNIGSDTTTTTINIGASAGNQTVNFGTGSGLKTINIGGIGDTVNMNGSLLNISSQVVDVSEKYIQLNAGSSGSGTATDSGFFIRDNSNDSAGYFKTKSPATSFALKAPGNSFVLSTPIITANDQIVTNNLSATLLNKTLVSPNLTGTVNLDLTAGVLTVPSSGDLTTIAPTNHTVQVGNSNNALTSLAAGTTGQMLLSVSSSNPVFTSNPSITGTLTANSGLTTTGGNITATSGDITASVLMAANSNITAGTTLTATQGDITASSGNLITTATTANATGSNLTLIKNRTAGIITTGDNLGNINFEGYDGSSNLVTSRITSTSSGTIGANRIASDLKFYVHPDSTSISTQHMQINSDGNLSIYAPEAGNHLNVANLLTISHLYKTFYSTIGIASYTVPAGVTQMTVKLWGAGGDHATKTPDSPTIQFGGGGGAINLALNVTEGDTYYLLIGGSGNTFLNGGTGGAGGSGIFGGNGGSASALFQFIGGNYVLKAVAAGGGGSGNGVTAVGGNGGASGVNGSNGGGVLPGFGGSIGNGTNGGGVAGADAGASGTTPATNGKSLIGDVSALVFSSLSNSSTDGDGGNGSTGGSTNIAKGGGGGGGYGGGGGGGQPSLQGRAGGGGAGGINYAPGGTTFNGTINNAGNNTDADYLAAGGISLYATGGSGAVPANGDGLGKQGLGVVIFGDANNTSLTSITTENTTIKTAKTTTTATIGTGIIATTGDISTLSGSIAAGTTMTGINITATSGNIRALGGNVTTPGLMSAGTTITAGTGITSTSGNIAATIGNITASASATAGTSISATAATLTAGTNIISTIGNITASNGDVVATAAGSNALGSNVNLIKNRAGLVITSGDTLGNINYNGFDGGANLVTSKIVSTSSGTITTNRVGSNLEFYTHQDSTTASLQRLTINSAGSVAINTPDSGNSLTTATGITATNGNITASAGNVTASAAMSTGTMTAGTGIIVPANDITAAAGNIIASGSITASSSNVTAGTGITSTLNDITAPIGTLNTTATGLNTSGSNINLIKNRAGSAITSGDILGNVNFIGFDGTANLVAANIISTSSGTIATNRVGSNLEFYTHPNSTSALAQRMVITSSGNITINAPTAGVGLTVRSPTVETGDISLAIGSIIASSGSGFASAGTTITATTLNATTGGITANTGNILATLGSITTGPSAVLTAVSGISTGQNDISALSGNIITTATGIDVSGSNVNLIKNRNGLIITTGDTLGNINFTGFDGTTNLVTSKIVSTSSGTITTNRVGSSLEFYTHPDSTVVSQQRMIIDSSGSVFINSPDAGGISLTTGTDITATTGNIAASSGNITAPSGIMTAGSTITAGTGMTATNNLTANNGNIVSSGSITASTVTATATAATTITAGTTSGNIVATLNNITVSSGNITTTAKGIDALGSNVNLIKNRGGLIITTGDTLGNINFTGFDGTANLVGSKIISTSSGTITTNRVGSNLEFYTHPDSTTATTRRMTINSAGSVTINVPDASGISLTTATGITASGGNITASSGNITASGSLSSTASTITAGTTLTLTTGDIIASSGNLVTTKNSADASGSNLNLIKKRGAGVITTGDTLGNINFDGFDGSSNLVASKIVSTSSGTIATNRIGSNLEFYTHPDSTTVATQRMLINSAGNVSINAPAGSSCLTLNGSMDVLSNITSTINNLGISNAFLVINNKRAYTTFGITPFTIPQGVTAMTVKMWGCGGNCAPIANSPFGGGAAAITLSLSVTAGDNYFLLIGGSTNTFMNGGISTGSVLASAGSGGSASALFQYTGGNYTLKAVAGGGGGGGGADLTSGMTGGVGGGGGTNGQTGQNISSGAVGGTGGTTGSNGTGGTGGTVGGNAGKNLTGDVSALVFSSLINSNTDGDGGGGTNTGGVSPDGGSGGGGYGGGGSGGAGSTTITNKGGGGGGAGGGSYAPSGIIFNGSGDTAGNNADSDYVAAGGTTTYASGGTNVSRIGKPGIAIISYTAISSTENTDYETKSLASNTYTKTLIVEGSGVNTTGSILNLTKNRNGGTIIIGDDIANINFSGFDGTSNVIGSKILGFVESDVSTNKVPGALFFHTHPNSTIASKLRLYINYAGTIDIETPDSGIALTIAGGGVSVTGDSFITSDFTASTSLTAGSLLAGTNVTALAITESSGNIIATGRTVGTTGTNINLIKNRSAAVITTGDVLGNINFQGFSTTNVPASKIISTSSGTIATNRIGSNLEFYTHPDSTTASTQRMIINSAGAVTINTPDSGTGLTVPVSANIANLLTVDGTTVTNVVSATGISSFVVPAGMYDMTVKLWGSGGSGSLSSRVGGGGAAITTVLNVRPGDTYYVVIGSTSNTFMNGGTGGNSSGNGGAASALFQFIGGNYSLLAVAGGGGGGVIPGTIPNVGIHGSGGGINGLNGNGTAAGSGGLIGNGTNGGGTAGADGAGGTGTPATNGKSLIGDVSALVFSSLTNSSTDGDGGNGANRTLDPTHGTGSGGGGGYGGGGGGGHGGSSGNGDGGAGAGGMSYAPGGTIFNGFSGSSVPGNSADVDYVAAGGTTTYASGGAGSGLPGKQGVAIIIYSSGVTTGTHNIATGYLIAQTGVLLPSANGIPSALNYHEDVGSVSYTFAGPVSIPANILITRFNNQVFITIRAASGTSVSATFFTSTAIPTRFWPSAVISRPWRVLNPTGTSGEIQVSAAGVITIYASISEGNFLGSGTVGWNQDSLTYSI